MKKYIALMTIVLTLSTFTFTTFAESTLYSDVTSSDWYAPSLNIMSENKIIAGFPDGTFKGSQTLSRDQYIVMLCRLIGDDPGLSEGYWAQNYINKALALGWLDNHPMADYTAVITRYEAALLTARAMGYTDESYPEDLMTYQIYANDFNEIPLLYQKDVLINFKSGIIGGYPDGTFRGDHTLTRAEGAVMAHRFFDEKVRVSTISPKDIDLIKASIETMDGLNDELTMPGSKLLIKTNDDTDPITFAETDLNNDISNITEGTLVDALIELSDGETSNIIAAGYNYGMFNINLLSEDDESLLIYSASDGSSVITIDLILLSDGEGNLKADAEDILRLICQNINYDYADDMLDFILTAYDQRDDPATDGLTDTIDGNPMEVNAQIQDHNVLQIIITVN